MVTTPVIDSEMTQRLVADKATDNTQQLCIQRVQQQQYQLSFLKSIDGAVYAGN